MKKTGKRRLLMGLVLGFALLALVSAGMAAHAAPASPYPLEAVQADGTAVTIFARGDEFVNWQEDANGYVVAYDAGSRNWCYAAIESDKLVPGAEIVGRAGITGAMNAPSRRLRNSDLAPVFADAKLSLGIDLAAPGAPALEEGQVPTITHVKNRQTLLVLLIEYTTQPFSTSYAANTNAYWSNHYFGLTGKTVNNYYAEVSGPFNLRYIQPTFTATGTFTTGLPAGVSQVVISDGVARVKLNKAHPGNNNTNVRADVSLAFNAVKGRINFNDIAKLRYNNVNNGIILGQDFTISTVIAGYDASANKGLTPAVWGHASYVYDSFSIDGTTKQRIISIDVANCININPKFGTMGMASYATQGEMFDVGDPMPVGVTVHELGHILGLPDLYSYDHMPTPRQGVGKYSVMASGSWGTDSMPGTTDMKYGNTPTHFDAWSKVRLGFVTPATVAPTTYWQNNLNSTATGSYNVLKLASGSGTQYFIVENRQFTGYDRALYASSITSGGILIWHVDETPFDVYDNDRNSPKINSRGNDNNGHRGLDLEGLWSGITASSQSNPFYVTGANGKFDSTTTPNSNFHTAGHNSNPFTHVNCHPQTVASNVQIRVNSASGNVMQIEAGPFTPVTSITGVPTTTPVGFPLTLTGTVNPSNASNKTITWSLVSAGTAGGSVSGSTLNTTSVGTTTVRATIANGLGGGTAYTQDFTITASYSSEKNVLALVTPAGSVTGTALTASVGNGVGSVAVNVTVSPAATWKLYSDAACTAEITSKTMNLAVGSNTAYIRVTAQDGSTRDYAITVTRAAATATKYIFSTKWKSTFINWLLFFLLFGWIWMWFINP